MVHARTVLCCVVVDNHGACIVDRSTITLCHGVRWGKCHLKIAKSLYSRPITGPKEQPSTKDEGALPHPSGGSFSWRWGTRSAAVKVRLLSGL